MRNTRTLVVLGSVLGILGACGGDEGSIFNNVDSGAASSSGESSGSSGEFGTSGGKSDSGTNGSGSGGVDLDGSVVVLDAAVQVCGDSKIGAGETCDDGNKIPGDGCGITCKIEPDFRCPMPGQPCVSTVVCGDGQKTGAEQCDDRNTASNDGCSATCMLETGWQCPFVGAACLAARCGDGLVRGLEECDDGNAAGGDGCSSACVLEEGFQCLTPGAVCTRTVCGNNVREGTEQCDDGNLRPYDGCAPDCKREPSCTAGAGCAAVCGDGLKFPGEACDDGNTRAGDGCSATCTIEPGYACVVRTEALPATLSVPIIYRDFKGKDLAGGNPDFEAFACGQITSGLVAGTLDAQGRPKSIATNRSTAGTPAASFPVVTPALALSGCTNQQLDSLTSVTKWFTDPPATPAANDAQRVVDTLVLKKQPDDSYVFDSLRDLPNGSAHPASPNGEFFPLDGRGWQDPAVPAAAREPLTGHNDANGTPHNFHFTSEARFWFTYDAAGAAPVLEFSGDDDVWVFINGRLAVDVGGLHGRQVQSVTIDAAKATQLGLVDKGLYDIAVFQAERHTNGSNYKLTLRGFLKSRSFCDPVCGDGIRTTYEVCDDGAANDPSTTPAYGKCAKDCKSRGPYCGDAITQTANGEECDNGSNTGGYGLCAATCKLGPRCGDGVPQPQFGEQCDDGMNLGGYGKCAPGCVAGPRCGDGVLQSSEGETCDDGNNVSGDGCNANCGRPGGGPA
jgi:fibro-slime domain-containing protein